MDQFMIHRKIWAHSGHQITTRGPIMDHSATHYKIMDRKEICIMETEKTTLFFMDLKVYRVNKTIPLQAKMTIFHQIILIRLVFIYEI